MPSYNLVRFMPDGNIEVVIDLTETPKFIYDNETLVEKQACKKVWISGIRQKYITIPSARNFEMFILNFRRGMVHPFVNMPLREITDHVIEADIILGKEILNLREQLLNQETVAAKFEAAEAELLAQYRNRLEINPFIDFAVKTILAQKDNQSMKAISDKAGYSQKHMIQLFKDHVGVAPKVFDRITRFQNAVAAIEIKKQVSWSALANDCGYYDQAHFITDFKNFTGFTPAEYMKIKYDHTNYLPIQ